VPPTLVRRVIVAPLIAVADAVMIVVSQLLAIVAARQRGSWPLRARCRLPEALTPVI